MDGGRRGCLQRRRKPVGGFNRPGWPRRSDRRLGRPAKRGHLVPLCPAAERFGIDIGGENGSETSEPVAESGESARSDYFETAIYDPLVEAVALILRGAAFIAGLSGMCVALALSYASTALGRQRALATTVSDLQTRIEHLEGARRA